ncbi:MAG: sugar isomerase domain-containing protein [Planctomycetota bacterium]
MLGLKYLSDIGSLIEDFASREGEALTRAATIAADCVAEKGAMHHFDTGHMKEEPIRRAGGFLGLHHLELRVEAEHRLPPGREASLDLIRQKYFYDREDLAALLLDKSHVRRGDVLIQVSNSGKEPFTVGVGLEAKKRGLKLIVLTSVAFSKTLEPRHSSGKRLFEVADAVVDMGSPFGDALIEINGLDAKVGASSGVLTAVALWSLMVEIAEALVARGLKPAIYKSVNLPEGFQFNAEQERLYHERGI